MSHRDRRQAYLHQKQQTAQTALAAVPRQENFAQGGCAEPLYWTSSEMFDFQQRLDIQRQLHEQTDLLRRSAPRF